MKLNNKQIVMFKRVLQRGSLGFYRGAVVILVNSDLKTALVRSNGGSKRHDVMLRMRGQRIEINCIGSETIVDAHWFVSEQF